jgi:hypothetical protein
VLTTPANDFVAGHLGNGIQINSNNEYARFTLTDGVTQNVELDTGTIDFWFKPAYAHTDGKRHTLVSIGAVGQTTTGLDIEKNNSLNGNEFSVRVSNGNGPVRGTGVASTNYSFTANQWIQIRVTWNFADSSRAIRIYFNGVEAGSYSYNTIPYPYSLGAENSTQYVYLGQRAATGTFPANGVLDELRIYNVALIP